MRKAIVGLLLIGAMVVSAGIPSITAAEEGPTTQPSGVERLERIKNLVAERDVIAKTGAAKVTPITEESSQGGSFALKVLQGLIICTGVFFIGVFLYRKLSGDRPIAKGRRMRVIERISVAPKASLVLAAVDGKEIVLAVGDKISLMRLAGSEDYQEEMEILCREVEGSQHSVS